MLACATLGARALSSEVPRRADEFVDSIGVNAHIDVAASVYKESVIGQLGIRHVRSNVKPGALMTSYNRLANLYSNYGVRVNVVCDSDLYDPTQYRDMMKHPMFESIEGLNEPDIIGNHEGSGPHAYRGLSDNWSNQTYPATLAYQQDLFNAMLADPVTAGKAVLSPAMGDPAKSRHLQGVAADFIAMHSYPGQEMPTGNFLTSFAIPSALTMIPPGGTPMRIIATETGYRSGARSDDISTLATKKYVPRLFAEYFRLGVVRTFIFELTDTTNVYNFGLLDAAYQPKPAYAAVKNLIGLLQDSRWDPAAKVRVAPEEFYPGALELTMNKGSANVHHVLLQKADGRAYLLLWQEVPSYDLSQHRDIVNPTVPVEILFNVPIETGALYTLDATAAKATYSNTASLRIDVPDEVVVLELKPGTPPPPPPPAEIVGPIVSAAATTAKAIAATGQSAVIAVSRTGATDSALTVGYSIGGTATSGVDYVSLPGSITIPAGASEASVVVTPLTNSMAGRKTLVLTANAGPEHEVSTAKTATVFFGESRTIIADFEVNASGWAGNAGALTTWTSGEADTGIGALKTVFAVNGVDRWINNFELKFASPQDWSAVSKLVLRVKESATNPASNAGKPVYFSWGNNGASVDGGYGVAKFPLTLDSTYRTVTLDLRDFPRNQVTSLSFYVDGAVLEAGSHTLYIDNVVAVTDSNGVVEDFEESGVENWSSGPHSQVQLERNQVDGGVQALAWVYNDTGERWGNHIELKFPGSIDLSAYSVLRFRIKEDAGNWAGDIGARVFVDWVNNGARANGDAGAGSFSLKAPNGYRTVELSIAEFKRDSISSLFFYLDGEAHATGEHRWYIDSITAY